MATAASGSALAGILLIPLLLPAVPFVLFSVSSFGGVTASVSGQSSYTLSLFNVASVTQYAWALWICFVLFIIATIYIALRETARNMYDPYYAKWENTWKAPVAVMVFWLVAEFLHEFPCRIQLEYGFDDGANVVFHRRRRLGFPR